MSQMNLNQAALDEIIAAAKNLEETVKRHGAFLVYGHSGKHPLETDGIYVVPGSWKFIFGPPMTDSDDDNALAPSQGFDRLPVKIDTLDERCDALVDLDP